MTRHLSHIDLNLNELRNAIAQVLAADPAISQGRFYYHSATKTFRYQTDTETVVLGRLDQLSAPNAAVSLGSQRITNLADPTAAQDAATKAYIDAAVAGFAWKDEVRVATTGNIDLAAGLINGAVVDGVTLATGDRVLVKNQTAGAENGIYVVAASGAAGRAADANSAAEITQAAVFVMEGTTNADTAWVNSTNAPITLGTTALSFVKFAGGATGSVNKFAATIGDGTATSIAVVHNLGSRDVVLSVHDAATFAEIECDVVKTDGNTVTLGFTTAPTLNSLRVTIVG